jgi:uncharacterized FlaG/YvyC family protein
MNQLSVAALRSVTPAEPQNAGISPGDRARTQAVVAAVQVLNQAGVAAADREVTYSTDSATGKLVIQVVDRQSRNVIVQWPSEYGLALAEEYSKKENQDK